MKKTLLLIAAALFFAGCGAKHQVELIPAENFNTEVDGKPVSLYGKRLEAEISMEALCPEEQGAKRCMQAADALVTKLSGGAPGLTISRICAEECRFAADADCYSCKVTAHALAYVYALANEEETEFTDFILKGEVQ